MTSPFAAALFVLMATWAFVATVMVYFEDGAEGQNIKGFADSFWWGVVTFLTVGYGDKFPVTGWGRLFAVGLMVAGVVCIAIVTAKISSYFLERALNERRGLVETESLNQHFVICGWKDEMSNFLLHILTSNRGIKSRDIVLVNNAPESEIEALLNIPELHKIRVVRGDFFLEVTLKRAAPERAAKILILADATPNASGQIPTLSEADARTVMTAMTLNNIAKGVLVAAEVLDSSMDQYLKLAHVNEIIYSREYSRLLLAKASMGTGVTNIFHELLDPRSASLITTQAVPAEFLQKPYIDLQSYFRKKMPRSVLLGVLENSGNSFVAKEKALRRAQLTPNISELVDNLQSVKALKFNQPVFGPKDDYILQEGSMVILIENREGELHV